jgi:signal transduction histidine kinase
MQHKNGHWVWVLDRGRVMTHSSDGQPLMMFGTHQDISARKQAEFDLQKAHDLLEQRVHERTAELSAANLGLEKAARMKDEFLASMSHELRTPLTGILGLSEALQMPGPGHDPLTEKQRTYLTHIHNSGEHLLEMVNDILDFSSIGSGKFDLNLVSCSLEEICQSSLRKTLAQADAKHLQHNFSMSPSHIIVSADAHRLQQILSNLLSNAVKFTPQGGSFGIEVRGESGPGCGTGLDDPSEKQVRITVWDTGIGIHEEDLSRLFQLFIQLDARTARQYNGTGLGLALVKRLTELHGGSVSVESTFGSGSRFTVCLPWQIL